MTDTDSSSGAYTGQPVPEALPMQSKRGYCGCCQELYTCLEQHLQTPQHRQYVSESRSQAVAKNLMERFLQDVIQYHPSRYKDNRPTYMDLPPISAPLIPKKELADIHSYQDDKETIGTREELPSTDNESIQSAHILRGKNVTGCNQAKDSGPSSLPVGDPASRNDTIVKEPASGEQAAVSSPSYKGLCRTAFLTASEGILSCGKVDRQGNRIGLGVYKPTSRTGIKDSNKPKVISCHGSEDHEHWNPAAQTNFPNVSSALKFSKSHLVSTQGTVTGPPLPQLRDHAGPSSPHCPGGSGQPEECKPPGRNGPGASPGTPRETKAGERAEDLVSETIETVIQRYCSGQGSRPRDSGSENSDRSQLQRQRGGAERGLPGAKWPLEKDPRTPSTSRETVCSRRALRETASCFRKMLSLTLSCESQPGVRHQGAGDDGASSGGSLSSLGSQLGQMTSTSSSEWTASVRVERQCPRAAGKGLELITDARISLEDHGYKDQLSSVLRCQGEGGDGTEAVSAAGSPGATGSAEERARPAGAEQRLPFVPPLFAGKTWSEIMAEDDLKVEALVKEFKEGRYLCYFDSESLANHGRKLKKKQQQHRAGAEASKGTSAETNPSGPEALPHLHEGDKEAEPTPALCPSVPGKKPAFRHCRLASRCQVVKVSHGTQTSEASYPVVRKKPREVEQEPENIWSEAERSAAGTRLCSLRLPRSYSRIMSPVQPRTVIYVLSSPDFESTMQAASSPGKRGSRTLPDGTSPTKFKYKKSPVRYYDPATNRILKTPPSGLGSSHHVRQLFRSLSPDINMGLAADNHRAGAAKTHPKACGLLQAGGLKARDWALGEAPSSDCPSKSTGSRSDGPPPPTPMPRRQAEQTNLVLSPLRREGPGSPFGRLNVYTGPRSRRAPEKENPGPASPMEEPPLSDLRGASSQSDLGAPTPSGPPRLRSGLRRPGDQSGSSGEKVLRRGTRGREAGPRERAVLRRSRRQGPRKRK